MIGRCHKRLRPSDRGIALNGNFYGSRGGLCASADFGNTAKDRCVKVARAALIANAYRNVFQDDKFSLMAQRLATDPPFTDDTVTMFASEIIHTTIHHQFNLPIYF